MFLLIKSCLFCCEGKWDGNKITKYHCPHASVVDILFIARQ